MRRRLQSTSRFALAMRTDGELETNQLHPLLTIDVVLAIPKVAVQPSLEEAQALLSRAVQIILKTTENVVQWEHVTNLQKRVIELYFCINCQVLFMFSCWQACLKSYCVWLYC